MKEKMLELIKQNPDLEVFYFDSDGKYIEGDENEREISNVTKQRVYEFCGMKFCRTIDLYDYVKIMYSDQKKQNKQMENAINNSKEGIVVFL